MNLKTKIAIIFSVCILANLGAYFIISTMTSKLENQLFEKCRIEARTGARVMSEIMEMFVSEKILSEKQIFDVKYIKITDSNPSKYHTSYDKIFDKYIQKIEDEFLQDPDVIYAVLIDKNGYVPTHNSKFSQKETGVKSKDLIYSRSKRNFSSYPGIRTALEYRGNDTIRSYYLRDTGEKMWNMGAPVWVRGKYWGAFVMGISLERLNSIQNQMIILIVTVMVIIMTITVLVFVAVLPRKLFAQDMGIDEY